MKRSAIKPKRKRCRTCKAHFMPSNTMQFVCGVKCAIEHAKISRSKEQKKKLKADKEKLKTRSEWLKEAQSAFNAFIRVRDHDEPCISCGRFHDGKYDAGHYRSVGAAAHLRFNLFNVFKQCVPCNQHLSGNVVEYRINLVKKIGAEKVDAIESNNQPVKFDIDYAKRVKLIFSKRARLYKKLKGLNG